MPNQASGTENVTGLVAHAVSVRGIQLRRRRSRVPWIYLLYHVRGRGRRVSSRRYSLLR